MSAQVSVPELLDAFPDAYHAIDMRTAAVLDDSGWTSAFTVLRLTNEEPEAVSRRYEELRARHGSIHTKHFAIMLKAQPISEWEAVAGECAEGRLRFDDVDVRLAE